MLTLTKEQQFEIYGQLLTGQETEKELKQIKRINYLKQKSRKDLEYSLGDTRDNISDVEKGLILGFAVAFNIIQNNETKAKYKEYVTELLNIYGGPEHILRKLVDKKELMKNIVDQEYMVAKKRILNETDIEKIDQIDLPTE